MARQLPIEIFMPPNMLKAKVGSAIGGIDMAAIKRAEAAMETLKVEFHDWLAEDVAKLGTSRDAFAAAPTTASREDLFRAAHDLKGQADTFEYPMIARMAASLTRLIDATSAAAVLPLGLVDAHVAAIRVVFRDKIKTTTDKMATVLVDELDARVSETIAGG
ncbi:MAG TPA: Hpt domain-containing protein [Rhizomicrobium sp.]|jgi:chemotaxis protein histidine kinase CheA|nr:Hpt domain-containing protein [Rhizomicrobium sp.]